MQPNATHPHGFTKSSGGRRLPHLLLFCFAFIYLLIIYSFFSFFFLSRNLLTQMFLCVSRPHMLEFLLSQNVSVQCCAEYHTPPPPSKPLASALLTGTTLLRTYHHPHSSLYKLRIGRAGFLFGLLTLEDGTDRLS